MSATSPSETHVMVEIPSADGTSPSFQCSCGEHYGPGATMAVHNHTVHVSAVAPERRLTMRARTEPRSGTLYVRQVWAAATDPDDESTFTVSTAIGGEPILYLQVELADGRRRTEMANVNDFVGEWAEGIRADLKADKS